MRSTKPLRSHSSIHVTLHLGYAVVITLGMTTEPHTYSVSSLSLSYLHIHIFTCSHIYIFTYLHIHILHIHIKLYSRVIRIIRIIHIFTYSHIHKFTNSHIDILHCAVVFLNVFVLRFLSHRGSETPICAKLPIPVRKLN